MSISYVDDISDGQGIFIFAKILGRWKGSLYKLVWVDLLIYIMAYYILNLSYRFAMNEHQRVIFEEIVEFCERTKGDIPISFLLGFFVAGIISRWYQMYLYIPWMNQIALHVAACVNGEDEHGSRTIRLTIMRYMNLAWVLMMQLISDQIASRFIKNEDQESMGSTLGPITPRRKGTSQKHVISRNTCHPWSINASDVMRPMSSKSFVLQPPPLPTQASKENQNFLKVDVQSSNNCNRPFTPTSDILFAPLATDEECQFLPDAFEADDVVKLRETFRAFNQDQKVKNTFGLLITEAEIAAFEHIADSMFRRTKNKYIPEYWIPMQWAQRLVLKALESGYISDPKTAYYTVENIGRLRKQMQDLQVYSSIMIPLVYTQVVIIAVYSYFMCTIFACQFVENRHEHSSHKIDLYVPIFNIFSFLFLMGWLKVALCVMNPFGDDDEDFQTSLILDYNLEVSYRSVYMEQKSFPEHLTAPAGKKRKPDENEPDDLQLFIRQINIEVAQVPDKHIPNDVSNLRMKPSKLTKMCHSLCCDEKPKRQQSVVVTNSEYEEKYDVDMKSSEVHPSINKWSWL